MTSFKQVKNNAKSRVTTDALNNTTSPLTFSVTTGEGTKFISFPGNSGYVTVWDDSSYVDPGDDPNQRIGLLTARTTDSLTVTWGQLGSSITAISGSPRIAMLMEDQHLKDLHTAVNTVETTKVEVGGDIGGIITAPLSKARVATKTVGTTGTVADYTCDGTADHVEINAAITAVNTIGGGEVRVRFGSYAGGTIIVKDNVSLIFEKNTSYTLSNATNAHAIENSDTTLGNTNIHIEGLKLNGNKANQTGTFHGIHFVKVTKSYIKNVIIYDSVYNNMFFDTCSYIELNDIEVYGAIHEGIVFSNTNYCSMINSISRNNDTAGMQLRGSSGSSRNTILNSKFISNTLYGLFVGQAADGNSEYNLVENCLVESNGDDALIADQAPHSIFRGNIVRLNGSHAGDQGIPVDKSPHSVVANNIVEYNRADGIEVKNSSNYTVISGNICRNNSNSIVGGANDGCGIVVRGDTTHCTIVGNSSYCDEVTPSQTRGIMLTDAGNDYNTVVGNSVYGNSVNQIEEAGGIATTSHNLIFGNEGATASKIVDQSNVIKNSTTSNALHITQTGNVGSSRTKGAFYLDNTSGSGNGLSLYDAGTSTGHVGPLSSRRVGNIVGDNVFDFNPAIDWLINVTTQSAALIDQNNNLASSRGGLVVQSAVDQTTSGAYALIASRLTSASSTIPTLWLDHAGSGIGASVRVASGKGIFIDNNGSANSIDIDQDGNSGSLITAVNIDVTNAGAGGTTALKVTGGKIDANTQKVVNLATPTASTDAATKNYVDTAVASIGGGNRNWNVADQGLVGWAYDPANAAGTRILQTAGRLHLVKVPVGTASSINNVYLDITTAGSGLTSAGIAVYQSGTLLAQSADQSTAFQGTNTVTVALTGAPISVSAGYVYIAIWANGTTLPTFAAGVNRSNINVGITSTSSRFGLADTSITTTAPSTLGTVSAASNSIWSAIG